MAAPELRGRGVRLSLVDLDQHGLRTMARYAERLRDHLKSDIVVESTTDRLSALPGADYVIAAVARNRMELWEQDFRVPLSHGFRHCLGENGGPGALFHTLRSLELVVPICRDIERLCPKALFLNFTNPEARVLHAVSHLTTIRAVGICHGVQMGIAYISGLLGVPADTLEVTAAGVNHFYAILKVQNRATGEDLLDECKRRVLKSTVPPDLQLFRKVLEVFDVFTFPSDGHIGEYLSFGAQYSGTKWEYGKESHPMGFVRNEPWMVSEEDIRAYGDGTKPIDERALLPSGEQTVPIIADMELDRGMRRPAVNVLNRDAYIENVPRSGAVEVPARVDRAGVHPEHVGSIPEPFAAYLRTQYAIHDVLTEAWRTRSRKLLLQALLLDPVVNDIAAAEQMLNEMLTLQKEFVGEYH
jgi:alpha-galactosidase